MHALELSLLIPDYGWSSEPPHTEAYLLKPLERLLQPPPSSQSSPRILDLGCGNGSLVLHLYSLGYEVVGLDPSPSGIEAAKRRCPDAAFHVCAADPIQLQSLDIPLFDYVISAEVVEHCYSPQTWADAAFQILKPGGILIVTTPYHGYLKNLLLAATGRLDHHFTALWEGGHIKFWSRTTLACLLERAGFIVDGFHGAGRLPWLSNR